MRSKPNWLKPSYFDHHATQSLFCTVGRCNYQFQGPLNSPNIFLDLPIHTASVFIETWDNSWNSAIMPVLIYSINISIKLLFCGNTKFIFTVCYSTKCFMFITHLIFTITLSCRCYNIIIILLLQMRTFWVTDRLSKLLKVAQFFKWKRQKTIQFIWFQSLCYLPLAWAASQHTVPAQHEVLDVELNT